MTKKENLYRILKEIFDNCKCATCNHQFSEVYRTRYSNFKIIVGYCKICNKSFKIIPIVNEIKLIYDGRL